MFSTEIFMARGHAYLWTPWLVWTQVLANTVIGLALLVVGVGLWRRPATGGGTSGYRVMAPFAVLLGAVHLLDVWVIWSPVYGLDAIVRSAGAVAGLIAGVAVVRAKG